jgi:hypothetical protein
MPTTKLLEKLLEIERSLGHADPLTIRAMLMEAQTELLRVEADVLQVMEDMHQLRERQERSATSALSPVSARAEKRVRTPVMTLTPVLATRTA